MPILLFISQSGDGPVTPSTPIEVAAGNLIVANADGPKPPS